MCNTAELAEQAHAGTGDVTQMGLAAYIHALTKAAITTGVSDRLGLRSRVRVIASLARGWGGDQNNQSRTNAAV